MCDEMFSGCDGVAILLSKHRHLVVKHMYCQAVSRHLNRMVLLLVTHIIAHMTQSEEEIRTLHVSASQKRKQLNCDVFGSFPGGHVPWQGSECTSPATDCHQVQAPTQAAPVKSSGHGATVIVRGCGQRRITPAASSKKMSLDFFMLSTRCVSGWSAYNLL